MLSTSPDFPKKSLQIKQDDKFFSKLVSKENSINNPSFRVYYGGVAGSVPFMWESQPGTPKHKFCDTSVPPLTPPPSYFFNHNDKPIKKQSRSKLLHTLFMRNSPKKANMPSSSPSSLSSSSWSSSLSSMSTSSNVYRRRRFLSCGSSFDDRIFEEEQECKGSTDSMMCFGINREKGSGIIGGGYSVVIMKKALMSVMGR